MYMENKKINNNEHSYLEEVKVRKSLLVRIINGI